MRQKKALIVDDSRTDAYLCAKVAQEFFSEVMVVGTPQELNAALRTFRPDILFLDVHIGSMHNGLGLIEEFRNRQDDTSILPMIVTTSSGDDATRALADRCGASGFILKPVTAEAMEPLITSHVALYPGKPEKPGLIISKMF